MSPSRPHIPVQQSRAHPSPSQGGFALLITITLVAFLVLILVTIASLTRVETTVATNSQQLSMARQNALAALNVALGELQKYAGPDQRATATADIDGATPATGTAKWTGVWGNAANPQSNATADMASAPVRLQWLVSGNEKTDFNPATHLSTAAASFGQITTAPSAWDYTPGSGTTDVTTAATVHTAVTVGGDDAVLLVGPATAGTAAGAENNYVVAPLVDIKVAPSDVPGAGTTGGDVLVGKYAWWVGDEGVKARINLVDPYVTPAPAMTAAPDPASPFRLMAPQRLAVERVPGFESFPVNDQIARKILNVEQSGLAHGSITSDVRQSRFHDLTTTSSGVLADQRRGGLKRDLTFAFAQSLADYRAALDLPDPAVNPLIPTTIMPANEHGPTWEQLHSFANLDGSAPIAPQPQTATQQGIYPVLVQARIGLFWSVEPTGVTTPTGEEEYKLILYTAPSFVLANPYNVPIDAASYRVRMDLNDPTSGTDQRYFAVWTGYSTTSDGPLWGMPLSEFFEGQDFRLTCRTRLEPGEARVFTLVQDNVPWSAEKTYELEDDWAEFMIRYDTNATFPEHVLYYRANTNPASKPYCEGLHFFFSAPPVAPTWVENYPGPTTNSNPYGNGKGGTLSWSLLDDNQANPSVYQRLETFGYNALRLSTYGERGSGYGPTFSAAAIQSPGRKSFGILITKMADAGTYSGSNSTFNAGYFAPYYSQFNWRAPLVGRSNYYNSKDDQGPKVSWRMGHKPTSELKLWLRPSSSGDPKQVAWNGVVGETNDQNLARENWQPFDVPRAASDIVSLGQLQHFNTGGYIDGINYPERQSPLPSAPNAPSVEHTRYISPTYAIGNSRGHPNVIPTAVSSILSSQPFYDFSYLINRELFDGYFFSTYPQNSTVDLTSDRLNNSRLQPFRDNINTDDEASFRGGPSFDPNSVYLAARNLMLKGAFNVNSTSIPAWTALLSSLRGTELNGETGLEGPFPRSINQPGNTTNSDDGVSLNAWNGFRELKEDLSNTEITDLATEIVNEIKSRGVSVTLGDFVNRRLTADGTSGPIQKAIDKTDINSRFPAQIKNQYGNIISGLVPADGPFSQNPNLAKHLLEGIAGWVSQADILQPLAPAMTARSDTFRIRTYGETRNPATGDVNGRAWCEATVQRLPDYVSDSEDATTPVTSLTSTDNQRFGRRFVVVDFRWLSPEDI